MNPDWPDHLKKPWTKWTHSGSDSCQELIPQEKGTQWGLATSGPDFSRLGPFQPQGRKAGRRPRAQSGLAGGKEECKEGREF